MHQPNTSLSTQKDGEKTMQNAMKTMFVVAIAALSMTMMACGDDGGGDTSTDEVSNNGESETNNEDPGTCFVPEGTYTMDIAAVDGDCPTEFVNEITSMTRDLTIEADEECGTDTFASEEELDNGCELTMTISAKGTATGVEEGSLDAEISCTDGSSCAHDFNVYFTKR